MKYVKPEINTIKFDTEEILKISSAIDATSAFSAMGTTVKDSIGIDFNKTAGSLLNK